MADLLIHIGPYKTGTTSFQNHMWSQRENFLKAGVYYPEVGIHRANFGARHLHLARGPKAEVNDRFAKLRDQIAARPDVKTVVLSSERFSATMPKLVARSSYYSDYNPKLVVSVRQEVSLIRSMYFQIVKSRFTFEKVKQASGLTDFAKWFEAYKPRFCYPMFLKPWLDEFGADSVIFVPYEAHRGVNIIESLSKAMGIPLLEDISEADYQNPSIGGLAAAAALRAARFDPVTARRCMEVAIELEAQYPDLKKLTPDGYDPERIQAYYDEQNAPAFEKYPAFKAAYDIATARD